LVIFIACCRNASASRKIGGIELTGDEYDRLQKVSLKAA